MFLIKNRKKDAVSVDYSRLPQHIAVIPDGNGRWAKKRSLPRSVGHREGANTLKKVVILCDKIGIKYLTVYAFSTENWSRPKAEVEALMGLLMEFLRNAEKELKGSNVRIRVIGDVLALPQELQKEIKRVVTMTGENTGVNLTIALNYGGKDEILQAVKKITEEVVSGKLSVEEINVETMNQRLYTVGIPDPDLIIRTSGEQRLSNFLIWQSAYAELWYTHTLWPDFKEEHLMQSIKDFQIRNRRFGGI